ncbi:MAG: 3-5 exonuclease family protein [Bryobacterales bacterium]|nr:3-5 exonuclease family protein [Bryobacterales bacterium]
MRLIAPSKTETALLAPFQGLALPCIHVPKTAEAVSQAGREIVASGIAGFDTESKPTFRVGEKSGGPRVVQFALRDRAFIFQLHRPECRAMVSELLQSGRVLKVGFGLRNDHGQIRSRLGVELRAIVDLDHVFRKRGYKGQIGVRAAVGTVLQQFPKIEVSHDEQLGSAEPHFDAAPLRCERCLRGPQSHGWAGSSLAPVGKPHFGRLDSARRLVGGATCDLGACWVEFQPRPQHYCAYLMPDARFQPPISSSMGKREGQLELAHPQHSRSQSCRAGDSSKVTVTGNSLHGVGSRRGTFATCTLRLPRVLLVTLAASSRQGVMLDGDRRRNTLADVTRDEQIGARYAMKMAALRNLVWRVLNWYRFLTPHYWRMRSNRKELAQAMQALLPVPYDPYAIELRSRSTGQNGIPDAESQMDVSWDTLFERLSATALDRRFAAIGAIEISAWAVEDVHSAFASMDHDVIAGVALRAHGAIDSFADLSQGLPAHTIAERLKLGLHLQDVDTHDLAHRALVGSVGEAAVLRHLHEANVDSALAPHLNTPGWDLTWDGHEVNVKTYGDVSDLSGHFDRYPHTAVVVPGDAVGIPEHSMHFDPATGQGLDGVHHALTSGSQGVVIVDDALSSGEIHDHLQHAETLATHGETVVHGHLPYVTLALSGMREFDLLLTGKTDFATAAKNAALDATGTGVGGAVGAKSGAVLGTMLWPGVGTVIGGIAGGIFGAMKGRKFTGDIKQRPFKEAVASYELAVQQFQSQARVHEAQASAEFNKARAAENLRLKREAHGAKQSVEQTKQAIEAWITYESWLQPDEACALIVQSSSELAQLSASIHIRYHSARWWRKLLWPDIETLAEQEALVFLCRAQRKLRVLHRRARKGQAVSRGQLMALLGAVGVMQEQTGAALDKIYVAQREREEQARSSFSEALAPILRERSYAEARLSKTLEVLRATIREEMHPALSNVNQRVECARLEGAKLGLSF